jgi:hypothetical protein
MPDDNEYTNPFLPISHAGSPIDPAIIAEMNTALQDWKESTKRLTRECFPAVDAAVGAFSKFVTALESIIGIIEKYLPMLDQSSPPQAAEARGLLSRLTQCKDGACPIQQALGSVSQSLLPSLQTFLKGVTG